MGELITFLVIICGLTCIIEMIPLLFLKRRGKWIISSFLCNVITNPIMNIILAILAVYVTNLAVYICIVIALEIAVILFEAFIFYNVMDESKRRCIIVSIVINTCSFLIGFLLAYAIQIADQSNSYPMI